MTLSELNPHEPELNPHERRQLGHARISNVVDWTHVVMPDALGGQLPSYGVRRRTLDRSHVGR
jgi:hypothetical protein